MDAPKSGLLALDENAVAAELAAFNHRHSDEKNFDFFDYFQRVELRDLIVRENSLRPPSSAIAVQALSTLRLLARDPTNLDVVFGNREVVEYVMGWAALPRVEHIPDSLPLRCEGTFEATKCLINSLFNSSAMRDAFGEVSHDALRQRMDDFLQSTPRQLGLDDATFHSLIFFSLKIVFITIAMQVERRTLWLEHSYYRVLEDFFDQFVEMAVSSASIETFDYIERINEILRTLFNLYCKSSESATDERVSFLLCRIRALLRCLDSLDCDVVQNCVNLLSPLPVRPELLCPEVDKENYVSRKTDGLKILSKVKPVVDQFDGLDMSVISVAIGLTEKKIDENNMDMLGPCLTVLIQYSISSKECRRFIRLKVLPPLREVDVSRRPDEGDTLRNKLVRIMMGMSRNNILASELMFVLCKRSVSRMIKYTGLGHSAGLLANSGLLGQINCPRSDENSEDSDTEDYSAVESNVNPVTGCIRPPEGISPFAGMSEEQKEVEALKLVDAMNKLMNSGVIKPGTIGADGKPRAVSHVLELTKDVPDERVDSDSD